MQEEAFNKDFIGPLRKFTLEYLEEVMASAIEKAIFKAQAGVGCLAIA
jgi:hypothetical protein